MATKGAKRSTAATGRKNTANRSEVKNRDQKNKHMTLAVSRENVAVLTQPADSLRADLWTEMTLTEVWEVIKDRLMPAPKTMDSVRKPRVKRASQAKENPILWIVFAALVSAVSVTLFSVIYTITNLA